MKNLKKIWALFSINSYPFKRLKYRIAYKMNLWFCIGLFLAVMVNGWPPGPEMTYTRPTNRGRR